MCAEGGGTQRVGVRRGWGTQRVGHAEGGRRLIMTSKGVVQVGLTVQPVQAWKKELYKQLLFD